MTGTIFLVGETTFGAVLQDFLPLSGIITRYVLSWVRDVQTADYFFFGYVTELDVLH